MSQRLIPLKSSMTADGLPLLIPELERAAPITKGTAVELEIYCRQDIRANSCQVTDPNAIVIKLETLSPSGASQVTSISMRELSPSGNCLGERQVSKRLSVPVTETGIYRYTLVGAAANFTIGSNSETLRFILEPGFYITFGSYSYATEFLAPEASSRGIQDVFTMLAGPLS